MISTDCQVLISSDDPPKVLKSADDEVLIECSGECPPTPWYSSFEVTLEFTGTLYFCKFIPESSVCDHTEQGESFSATVVLTDTDGLGLAIDLDVSGLPFSGVGHTWAELWCPCSPGPGENGKGGGVTYCNPDVCQPGGNRWWFRFVGGFQFFNGYPNPFLCPTFSGPDPFISQTFFFYGAGSGCEWDEYGDQVAPEVAIGGSTPGVIPYGTHTGSFGVIQRLIEPPQCGTDYVHFGAVTCNWTAIITA